ncbi:MAG: hypothetical protein WBD67_11210 [Terracidiphilus sp.]
MEVIICRPDGETTLPRATEWGGSDNKRRLGRVVVIPEEISLADGLRALGGYPDRVIAYAEEFHPKPLNVGSMLALKW